MAFNALQELSIDADVVFCRIGLGAQLGHDLAVHLHAAAGDQLLGLAAGTDAGSGDDLLQPL